MPKRSPIRHCPICGREFKPSNLANRQRYDSYKCKRRAEYLRLRYVAIRKNGGEA